MDAMETASIQTEPRSLPTCSRFFGCLLGGAVGDALGAPVEFMQRSEILRSFGPGGITRYAPAFGGLGRITDDTQMTLFTAEGLIRGWVRGHVRGIVSYPDSVARAYLRWLHTQGERSVEQMPSKGEQSLGLLQHKELYSRRAPGNTCLSSLRSMSSVSEPAANNSKGCGGVMRVAPVGLFAWSINQVDRADETFALGAELAAITHGHPTGSLTAGVLAVLIQSLAGGASLSHALTTAVTCLRLVPGHQETLEAIDSAARLARSSTNHSSAITQLGQGWVAEEALAISVYCALVAKDFREGIVLAVNHDGDSDSTGAITGNLLGAAMGVETIPEEWLESLELRAVIADLAGDLHRIHRSGRTYSDEELIDSLIKKYP